MPIEGAAAVAFLTASRCNAVDLVVTIDDRGAQGVRVTSTCTTRDGTALQRFVTDWTLAEAAASRTEYLHGISLIHDTKDHLLYGLGFTPLTEIQTIVQTYLGRAILREPPARAMDVARAQIRAHIHHEMYATRGRPLVYSNDGQRGLLDRFAPTSSGAARLELYADMVTLAEDVMLPPLRRLYETRGEVCALQAPVIDSPDLVEALVPDLIWSDPARRLLRLTDNLGQCLRVHAQVDDELRAISAAIQVGLADRVTSIDRLESLPGIFSCERHVIPLPSTSHATN